jgi:hypothetical protein
MRAMHPPKAFFVCCAAAISFTAGCGQNPPARPAPPISSNLPGCRAAIAKVDYGTGLVIPDETKALVESYRSDWRKFCNAGQESSKPTMADLTAKAGTLKEQFDKVIAEFNRRHRAETFDQREPVDAASDLLMKKYPAFVPAFEGSIWEYEYFRPSSMEFRNHAELGTVEDRRFFAAGIDLESDFQPWLAKTWDYGGCLSFGKFNWVDALMRVTQLKRSLYSDIYRKVVSDFETRLLETLEDTGSVCTCDRKEVVLEDLQQALAYMEKEPTLSSHVPMVRSRIAAIQSKTIRVDSEAEKHCSGG